jgi:hypothetical protein
VHGQRCLDDESVHADHLLPHDVSACHTNSLVRLLTDCFSTNLNRQFWVKVCAAYTLAGFIAVQLTLFLNCRPFSGYFTLPPPHDECATYFRFEIIQAVFNISSDLAILVVIMPTLWRMNMSLKEKVPVLFIFSMGFFLVCISMLSWR